MVAPQVKTHSGWAYAAFVIDVFSRMVVGWQVATRLYTELFEEQLRSLQQPGVATTG